MARYSFTGTSKLADLYLETARSLVRARVDGTEFTTGAQYGFDTLACREALIAFPGAHHRVIVPQAPHNEELVEWAYRNGAVIVQAPPGRITASDPSGHRSAYRSRNLTVVEFGDVLVACARLPEARLPYSGTWATVRIGRKAGLPIIVKILDRGDRAAAAPGQGRPEPFVLGATTDRPHETADAPGKERS